MKAENLIKRLEQHPEAEVFVHDAETEDELPLGEVAVKRDAEQPRFVLRTES